MSAIRCGYRAANGFRSAAAPRPASTASAATVTASRSAAAPASTCDAAATSIPSASASPSARSGSASRFELPTSSPRTAAAAWIRSRLRTGAERLQQAHDRLLPRLAVLVLARHDVLADGAAAADEDDAVGGPRDEVEAVRRDEDAAADERAQPKPAREPARGGRVEADRR